MKTWTEFIFKDLGLNIIKPQVFHRREVTDASDGIEYITRTKFNNGVTAIVERTLIVNPAGTISFGSENASFFFRPKEWISGRDIYYIDTRHLTKNTCLFLTVCLQKIASFYPYNFGLFPRLLEKEKIMLPIDNLGNPDYQYMDEYMLRLSSKVESDYNELSSASKIPNPRLDTSNWQEVPISHLFQVVKGSRLTKKDMKDGEIPFIGASSANNGITAYIANDSELHPANTITVAYNGSVGESFYQEIPFWASDDINVLYPKFTLTRNIAMFLIPILKKKGQNYAFIDKWNKEAMENDTIKIPVKPNGKPDFEYMSSFIEILASRSQDHLNKLSQIL